MRPAFGAAVRAMMALGWAAVGAEPVGIVHEEAPRRGWKGQPFFTATPRRQRFAGRLRGGHTVNRSQRSRSNRRKGSRRAKHRSRRG